MILLDNLFINLIIFKPFIINLLTFKYLISFMGIYFHILKLFNVNLNCHYQNLLNKNIYFINLKFLSL